MSKFTTQTCKDCEFYESKHDRANAGDCLLDFYGSDGIVAVKADHSCESYVIKTVQDE